MRIILVLFALALPAPVLAQAGPVGAPGRYVIVHSPHIQSDTVLLDTATGKTWQLVQNSNREGEPLSWTPLAREDNAGEYAAYNRAYPVKPKR
jgi:hypothetical protein